MILCVVWTGVVGDLENVRVISYQLHMGSCDVAAATLKSGSELDAWTVGRRPASIASDPKA